MFELPEIIVLARQINQSLQGKVVQSRQQGNSPHKFVRYNRSGEEFERLTRGKHVGKSYARGRWLFIPLEPGYLLLFGECGGKILYHLPGSRMPQKYHLYIQFEDGSFLTAMTQMWGAMELYEQGQETERQYLKGMRITPFQPEFTFDYFCKLIDEVKSGSLRSAKALLTQEQVIPGLGNAIAQDVLFHAHIHPRHPLASLNFDQKQALYRAIVGTVSAVVEKGGRYDEVDLYGHPGGYFRLMDSRAIGRPCPTCGGSIETNPCRAIHSFSRVGDCEPYFWVNTLVMTTPRRKICAM